MICLFMSKPKNWRFAYSFKPLSVKTQPLFKDWQRKCTNIGLKTINFAPFERLVMKLSCVVNRVRKGLRSNNCLIKLLLKSVVFVFKNFIYFAEQSTTIPRKKYRNFPFEYTTTMETFFFFFIDSEQEIVFESSLSSKTMKTTNLLLVCFLHDCDD